MIAACLQDYGRAVIVGERTAGDVGVLNVYRLTYGNIAFTGKVLSRPSGKTISKLTSMDNKAEAWGVLPDQGFGLRLSPEETKALQEHLRLQEIIPRRDLRVRKDQPKFKDRQLELALAHLKRQVQAAK